MAVRCSMACACGASTRAHACLHRCLSVCRHVSQTESVGIVLMSVRVCRQSCVVDAEPEHEADKSDPSGDPLRQPEIHEPESERMHAWIRRELTFLFLC